MEEIVKTTRYWLFKKTEKGNHYYVRIKADGINTVSYWKIGYKNIGGFVSLIGDTLNYTLSKSLEEEYQIEIDRERKESLNYKATL